MTTLKDKMTEVKVERAIDEVEEADFIGDEEADREEFEKLLAMAEASNIGGSKKGSKVQSKGHQITREEKRQRIREIILVSNKGFSYTEVIEYGVQRWGCSKRTVERYIQEARKVEAVPESDLKSFRNDAVSRCLYIYKKAIKNNSEGIALQAQKEINKLLGLYRDQILLTQGNTDNPVKDLIEEMAKSGMTEDDIIDGALLIDEPKEDSGD